MEKIPYFGQTLIRWNVGDSTFLALPEKGARLMNWSIQLPDGTVRDVIHWPEVKTLDDFHKVRGGNPILFPFCGRSFDKGEIGFWRDAKGVRRPMPMHGLARQGEFRTARIDANGFDAVFIPGAEAAECYPFRHEFRVEYRFSAFGLTCRFTLENLGDEPLPWCAGHHFYFALPWAAGSLRRDYLVRIPAGRRLRQDPTGQLIAGPALRLNEPMDNPALIDTFHTDLKESVVVFGEKGLPGDVAVRLGDADLPEPGSTFVTWTLADDSPFYCVEPWMGPPNAMEQKIGLRVVPPGARQAFTVSIAVR